MSKPLLRSKAPRKRRHRQSHHVLGSKSSFDSLSPPGVAASHQVGVAAVQEAALKGRSNKARCRCHGCDVLGSGIED